MVLLMVVRITLQRRILLDKDLIGAVSSHWVREVYPAPGVADAKGGGISAAIHGADFSGCSFGLFSLSLLLILSLILLFSLSDTRVIPLR